LTSINNRIEGFVTRLLRRIELLVKTAASSVEKFGNNLFAHPAGQRLLVAFARRVSQ
jgi:hypothetical protein